MLIALALHTALCVHIVMAYNAAQVNMVLPYDEALVNMLRLYSYYSNQVCPREHRLRDLGGHTPSRATLLPMWQISSQ